MAEQKSFARAVYDGDIIGPKWDVVGDDGTKIDQGNQDFGHTRLGRAVRFSETGDHITTVIDFQYPYGTNTQGKTETLIHPLGGTVTKIKCGVINAPVVTTDGQNGTYVHEMGQKSINTTRQPDFCPLRSAEIGERALADFAVCFNCDDSAVARFAIYRPIS